MLRLRAVPCLALALLLALVASRLERGVISLPFIDRLFLERHFATVADRGWDGYPAFLEGVRARTKNGDTIALLVPARHWDNGYSYAYYRASYLLAGRQVVPLVTPDDQVVMKNLNAATLLAAWRMSPPAGHPIVWQENGGTLVRR